MAAWILPAAALAVSVYSKLSGDAAQREAQERDLELKRLQADELEGRQAINEEFLRKRGLEAIARAQTAAEGTGNVGVGFRLKALHNLQEAIEFTRRDAYFKAMMLREGANIQTGLISDQATASYIGAGGTILAGAANIYGRQQMYSAPSDAQSLPSASTGNEGFSGQRVDFQGDNPYKGYA